MSKNPNYDPVAERLTNITIGKLTPQCQSFICCKPSLILKASNLFCQIEGVGSLKLCMQVTLVLIIFFYSIRICFQ